MDSAMIGKIEKAKQYALEKERRIAFDEFQVAFQGNNSQHRISFDHGQWACDCHFFATRGVCSHTMALERVLDGMLHAKTEQRAAKSS